MTKHSPIDISAIPDAAHWRMVREGLSVSIDAASKMQDGQRALGEALSAALDTVAAGAPRYEAFGDMRETARWWADCATPVEIEIYLSVILRRLDALNKHGLSELARKRVFMGLWEAIGEKDQKAFLAKVSK